MQVITLGFEGVGPFTGRHSIDVAALGAGGLFLLEGPTGSGKTTILDALVFALYGDVAGADSSKARIVSTQLPPGVEPFVEATIETGRGLLRVRRVPQHERRKTRGVGTTVGKAAIQLWRLASPDDPGTLLSTSLQEASEELQRAIGLTKEQFTQTVVLPQGHFATFLRAKPEERRSVLQDIFGTEFYERCAKQLSDLAAGWRAQDADARAALDRAAASFAGVSWDAGAAVTFVDALADDPASALVLAEVRVGELSEKAAQALSTAAAAAAKREEAQRGLAAARERNEAIAERQTLLGRLAQLEAAGTAVAADAERLDAAERAEHARHAMEALARASAAAEAAALAARRGLAGVADLADGDLAQLGPDELEAAGLAARDGQSALSGLVELEGGLGSRAQSLRLGREGLNRRRSAAEREQAGIDAARDAADQLVTDLEAPVALVGTLGARTDEEASARACRDACARRDELAGKLADARGAEDRLGEAAAEASGRHRSARTSWLGGLAGTLASELEGGVPCPVCGSTEHPAPAVLPEGSPDRAKVERLEADARGAERALAEARSRCDVLAGAIDIAREAAGDTAQVEAELELSAAVQQREAAERAAVRVKELTRQREELLTGASAREKKLHEAEEGCAAEQGALDARAERLDADTARVADQVAAHASVAERAAALGVRAGLALRLSKLRQAATKAAADRIGREKELATILDEEGIADAETARGAQLAEAERARLQRLIDDHRTALATVTQLLAEARLGGLGDAVPADLAPLEDGASATKEAAAAAERLSGGLSVTLKASAGASALLRRGIVDLEAIRRQAGPYLAMADLASGGAGNQASITLPTFVLLRRFEEVVDLANVRLDAMTGGRYSLRRTDAREGRSQKLGLGLEVVDHSSGDSARDPKTLSGGETFQASLSMALGLADAVTSEAGGIELNTLFVDEGFGSLDSEALDMVMDQLLALRDAGRSIGVISHVAEMKQRIAERITVIPGGDGTSTLRCSTDGTPTLVRQRSVSSHPG